MPIQVDNLFYTYSIKTPNEYEAIKDISFHIDDHSFIAIVGETGSGKSTLIQHLNGLIYPQKGIVQVNDFVLDSSKKKIKTLKQLRKHVGVVFQFPEYQLFEETIEKDVAFGPKNFGIKEEVALKIAHKALLEVGIKEDYFTRSPFELSGGERRRVAIAGILALDPQILVLDEPTAGLDPKGQEVIMSLIQKMHENGKTIIIVTHDMDLVFKYAEKVLLLKDGKLIFSGTPIELFKENGVDSAIEIPLLYQFLKMLEEKGFNVPFDSIKSVDDLVTYLVKVELKK